MSLDYYDNELDRLSKSSNELFVHNYKYIIVSFIVLLIGILTYYAKFNVIMYYDDENESKIHIVKYLLFVIFISAICICGLYYLYLHR